MVMVNVIGGSGGGGGGGGATNSGCAYGYCSAYTGIGGGGGAPGQLVFA
jgi:hypothetical protein